MSKILKVKKFKICSRFEEDVFGLVSIRPSKSNKSITYLYNESISRDFKFKVGLKRLFLKKLKNLRRNVKFFLKNYFKNKKLKNFVIDYSKVFSELTVLFKKKLIFLNIIKESLNSNYSLFLVIFDLFCSLYLLNKTIFGKSKFFLILFLKRFILALGACAFILKKGNLKNYFNFEVDSLKKSKRVKARVKLFKLRLLTRHKLCKFAGYISVKKFYLYVKDARNSKFFTYKFLWLLESRLDTIIYRMNMALTPFYGRHFLNHHGILVNGSFVNVNSYKVKFSDIISFVDKKYCFNYILERFFKKMVFMSIPVYYEVNFRIMSLVFWLSPSLELVSFPFNVDSMRLAGIGTRF